MFWKIETGSWTLLPSYPLCPSFISAPQLLPFICLPLLWSHATGDAFMMLPAGSFFFCQDRTRPKRGIGLCCWREWYPFVIFALLPQSNMKRKRHLLMKHKTSVNQSYMLQIWQGFVYGTNQMKIPSKSIFRRNRLRKETIIGIIMRVFLFPLRRKWRQRLFDQFTFPTTIIVILVKCRWPNHHTSQVEMCPL